MQEINKILIIRFRQLGDAVLATALCNTLKNSFPNAEIHFVLNKGIAPLFDQHPSIDKVITFDNDDNKKLGPYISKIWKVTHTTRYDAIIDMRSTIRTLLFSLFSLHTPFRIGRIKWYSKFLHNYRIDNYSKMLDIDMVKRNLMLASPLEKVGPIAYTDKINLSISAKEKEIFKNYMKNMGIDTTRPVILVGVTTKLQHKRWDLQHMTDIIREISANYKDLQLIFNYAPGKEEFEAREIYKALGSPTNIFIDLQAKSLKELIALCCNSSLYFGNEGGARHVAQAMNVPSFAIYSPNSSKSMWLPKNSTQADGIAPSDLVSKEKLHNLNYEDQFSLITLEEVYKRLKPILDKL